jgi:hypothetical protein
MGYKFYGSFIPTDQSQEIMEWASREIPFCNSREIYSHFVGIGFECPNEHDLPPDAGDHELEDLYEQIEQFEIKLIDLSQKYPDMAIAYVLADCFGGTCFYDGYVLKNGVKILEVDCREAGPQNLIDLLEPLGIKLNGDGYFQPLTRNYFYG